MTPTQNRSMQLFLYFVKIVSLEFFANMKPFLVKMGRVFKIVKKESGQGYSEKRFLRLVKSVLPILLSQSRLSLSSERSNSKGFHIFV